MQVFVFDWLPYGENLDKFRVNGEMPRLGREHFDPQVAVDTYSQPLEAWVELERHGFDGIGINEHHGTPFGLGNSPNLIAAAIARMTQKLKILVYANLLPIHEPLRLAEELAMLDCLSNGRLIAGVARGAPREYRIFNVPHVRVARAVRGSVRGHPSRVDGRALSRSTGSSTSTRTCPSGRARCSSRIRRYGCRSPSSRETIEWAAANDIAITPGVFPGRCAKIRSGHMRAARRGYGPQGHRLVT